MLDCTTHLIPNPAITYDVVPGREDFEKGHIKGAQFCDVSRDVSDTSHKFRFMRQSPEDFAAAMRRFGVSDDTKVVTLQHGQPVVGDARVVAAARIRPRQCRGAERRLAEMVARKPAVRNRSGDSRARPAISACKPPRNLMAARTR